MTAISTRRKRPSSSETASCPLSAALMLLRIDVDLRRQGAGWLLLCGRRDGDEREGEGDEVRRIATTHARATKTCRTQ